MAQTPSDVRRAGGLLRRIDPLLDAGAGVVLGVAAGFFFFAMPARILVPLLGALGLPVAIAGGQAALAGAVAILVAGATWGAFRLTGGPGREPAAPLALIGNAAPVLRRADAHPDAPARRPIFAGSDLGAPLDMARPLPPGVADPPETPAPAAMPEAIAGPPPGADAPAPPAAAPATPPDAFSVVSLAALMTRLEMLIARKAMALDGKAVNVTPPKREIRPVEGGLVDALDRLLRRAARR